MIDGTKDVARHRTLADSSTAPHHEAYSNGSADGPKSTPLQTEEPIHQDNSRKLHSAIAQTVLPIWLGTISTLLLIFGGCCSNVFTLEAIVKQAPGSGTLITCFQVLFTVLLTLPANVDSSRGIRHLYLRPRAIPLQKWLVYTAFFLTINILNNKAFSYKISVPLHIILRSAGPVATIAVGYLVGRRYSKIQVAAVLLLFAGVVQAAIADARAKGSNMERAKTFIDSRRPAPEFLIGFAILFLALILSSVMGLFADRLYATYGRDHTEENLFYSHALSLPFFLAQYPLLSQQSRTLFALPSKQAVLSSSLKANLPTTVVSLLELIPPQALFLILNGLTQFFCIRGVNQLSARSSSLTVGIVLNIRKLVSLLLSIWLFGNRPEPGVLVGAAIVFVGASLYALPGRKTSTKKTIQRPSESKKEL